MDMLIGLILVIITQGKLISKHHIVHVKYIQFLICQLHLIKAKKNNVPGTE